MPHLINTAADAAGRLLSAAAHGLTLVRRPAKPLHPRGRTYRGRLVRFGSAEPTGSRWLDDPGADDVVIRLSRAVGLPGALPDIHGLALRAPVESSARADVLLATTGWSSVGRHVLVPYRSADRPMSTLLPYRSPTGPVVLGARPQQGSGYRLYWARVGGPWRPFADLSIETGHDPVGEVSFDPVLNPIPGLDHYRWVVALRERAYATARAHRAAPRPE